MTKWLSNSNSPWSKWWKNWNRIFFFDFISEKIAKYLKKIEKNEKNGFFHSKLRFKLIFGRNKKICSNFSTFQTLEHETVKKKFQKNIFQPSKKRFYFSYFLKIGITLQSSNSRKFEKIENLVLISQNSQNISLGVLRHPEFIPAISFLIACIWYA